MVIWSWGKLNRSEHATGEGACVRTQILLRSKSHRWLLFFPDQSCACCCGLPRVCANYGVHPAKRFLKIYGEHIAQKVGNPDITFGEVWPTFCYSAPGLIPRCVCVTESIGNSLWAWHRKLSLTEPNTLGINQSWLALVGDYLLLISCDCGQWMNDLALCVKVMARVFMNLSYSLLWRCYGVGTKCFHWWIMCHIHRLNSCCYYICFMRLFSTLRWYDVKHTVASVFSCMRSMAGNCALSSLISLEWGLNTVTPRPLLTSPFGQQSECPCHSHVSVHLLPLSPLCLPEPLENNWSGSGDSGVQSGLVTH